MYIVYVILWTVIRAHIVENKTETIQLNLRNAQRTAYMSAGTVSISTFDSSSIIVGWFYWSARQHLDVRAVQHSV